MGANASRWGLRVQTAGVTDISYNWQPAEGVDEPRPYVGRALPIELALVALSGLAPEAPVEEESLRGRRGTGIVPTGIYLELRKAGSRKAAKRARSG